MTSGNLMLSLPFMIKTDMTMEGQIMSLAPWGAPLLLGGFGHSVDKKAFEIVIAYEWPIPYLSLQEQQSKEKNEATHLKRMLKDYGFSRQEELFENIIRGDDPPDFYATRKSMKFGVDVAQYTLQDRRHANAKFEEIKEYIANNCSEKLAHLRGFSIYFWYWEANNLDKPHIAPSELKELLDALERYKPNPTIVDGDDLPEHHPGWHVGSTKKTSFYAHPFTNSAPDTAFFYKIGFKLGPASFTQTNTENHDHPRISQLILTCGAPNRNGFGYLSDEHLMRMAINNPMLIDIPHHITNILVHFWTTGEIYSLFPQVKLVSPALRPAGITLRHNPFMLRPKK